MLAMGRHRFASSDAWLLASLLLGYGAEGALTRKNLIEYGDAINHAIFTQDEIEGGITRLANAGLLLQSADGIVPAGNALAWYAELKRSAVTATGTIAWVAKRLSEYASVSPPASDPRMSTVDVSLPYAQRPHSNYLSRISGFGSASRNEMARTSNASSGSYHSTYGSREEPPKILFQLSWPWKLIGPTFFLVAFAYPFLVRYVELRALTVADIPPPVLIAVMGLWCQWQTSHTASANESWVVFCSLFGCTRLAWSDIETFEITNNWYVIRDCRQRKHRLSTSIGNAPIFERILREHVRVRAGA
jgi:hypothetical protein